MIEIHGKCECPFAWRVRICAREKALPFEWIPFDGPDPDPRAMRHNPEKKSPKLWEDGFELLESSVILRYLDEAYPDKPLQALGARDRALMGMRLRQIGGLEAHPPEIPPEPKKLERSFAVLDKALSDGRAFLGGTGPDLSDVAAWPFLLLLDKAGYPPQGSHLKAYWDRIRERDPLLATRPH